ncbi:Hypothetical predicted protein, partial [Olea europaea subsp. europaea]
VKRNDDCGGRLSVAFLTSVTVSLDSSFIDGHELEISPSATRSGKWSAYRLQHFFSHGQAEGNRPGLCFCYQRMRPSIFTLLIIQWWMVCLPTIKAKIFAAVREMVNYGQVLVVTLVDINLGCWDDCIRV